MMVPVEILVPDAVVLTETFKGVDVECCKEHKHVRHTQADENSVDGRGSHLRPRQNKHDENVPKDPKQAREEHQVAPDEDIVKGVGETRGERGVDVA